MLQKQAVRSVVTTDPFHSLSLFQLKIQSAFAAITHCSMDVLHCWPLLLLYWSSDMLRKALINGEKCVCVLEVCVGSEAGDDLFQCHLDPWRWDTAQLNRIGPTAPLWSTAREFCKTRTHTGPDSKDPITSIWSAFRFPLPPKNKNGNDLNQNKLLF